MAPTRRTECVKSPVRAIPDSHPSARCRPTARTSPRVRNHLLGSKDSCPADATAGETVLLAFPDIAAVARHQGAPSARVPGIPVPTGSDEPQSHALCDVGRKA